MPKRPEQAPASVSGPRFARPTPERERPTHARSTRPFRFGSEDRPDPDPPLEPGALVGERYKIVRLLGEGGMGRVYEAEHTVLSRRVALKLLRRDAQSQPENLARFRQEALAASRIGTAQIIEVVDFASHTGPVGVQTYMVMELLAGESLEDWMDRSEPLDVGVELLAQLCDGLAAAHRAGVIHRDIKPANVFCQAPETGVGTSGRANIKILDFGIAKMVDGAQSVQTQQGSLLGTPYYLAPERVMGNPLTAAADVYSVGVILYEMLTGNVPFVADSFMGILARHVHAEPLDPRQAAPERAIPDSIASVCMRLLSKEPHERPSAAELAAELRGMLTRERSLLARVSVGPRAGTSGAGEDTQVLAGVGAEAISERPTLPPAMDGFALAPRVEPPSRGRSGTAIGHAAVADHGSVMVRPAGATQIAAAPTSRRVGPWIAAVVLVIAGVGAGGYSLWRSQQDGAVVQDVPVAEAGVGESPPNPNPTPSDAKPREREPSPAPPTEATQPVAQPQPVVEPPAAEPTEATARKPASGSGKKPSPPPDKPPSEPEAAPEPTPSEAKDPPPDSGVDPQLPTIKDDVYD
jgi:serine/threonine protein kinase